MHKEEILGWVLNECPWHHRCDRYDEGDENDGDGDDDDEEDLY